MGSKRPVGCVKLILALIVLFAIVAILLFRYVVAFSSGASEMLSVATPPPPPPPAAEPANSVPVKTQIVGEDTSPLEDSPETFPPIWCNYARTLGFDGYARAMEQRGCVFFYFSKRQNMWRAINYTRGTSSKFDVGDVGKRWGNRPSKISDESLLKPFLKDELAGTDVFFGKPVSMESNIRRTITQKLKMSGINPSQLIGIRGVYILTNGTLFLRVNEIVQKEGGARSFLCDVIL